MSIGFAALPSAGRTAASAARVSSLGVGSSRPSASQASAARIPSPPAFVTTATRRPRGTGCAERSDATSISSSSVRARITPASREERVGRGVRAGERGRVRPRGPAAGARRAALQREDRLAARDPARDARERARVAERLEVEDDELGLVVVLPPLEQVVRRDVRLVADGHEGGDAEAGRLRALEQREAERAALRGEADLARREAARRERRVEVDRRGGDAEAVRAEETRAVLADEREQPLLPLGALAARLGEARGDDDERANAGGERFLCRASTCSPGTQMTARSTASAISPTAP